MHWCRAWCVTLLTGAALGACRPELRYRTPSEIGASASSRTDRSSGSGRADSANGWQPLDRDLELAIRRAVDTDPSLGAHRVDIDASRGVVTLSGRAGSGPSVQRMMDIAERTRGVLMSVSQLQVAPPPVPDSEIHAAINALLGTDPAVQGGEIEVSLRRGQVTISGEVRSKALVALATELCWSARGVSSVDNRLTLRPNEARSDAELQHDLVRRLAIDAYLHDRPIQLRAEGGTVTLSGTVPSAFLKRRARALSELVASSVEDVELRVEGVPPGESPIAASDEQTAGAVEDALRYDPRLEGVRLGVRATRGTVRLTGTVESLRQKLAAERSALETVGVWAVENTLQVRPAYDLADDEILSRLRDRLRRDAVAGGADIRVEVANARAILRGNVSSREEKVLAEIAVASEPALIAVDNRLSVDKVASPFRDDLAIEDEIESRLSWDARVDPVRIFVEVHDGVALLRGEVASRTVYDATLESAFAAGAREVVAGLRREDGPLAP
jgi:osmotically-inducible protein OsmY